MANNGTLFSTFKKQEKLERVIAFMDLTESALKDCNIFGFIDNLYAAAELLGEIMIIIVKQGNVEIPRIHPQKFNLYKDHVDNKQLIGGDFINVYQRLLRLKNKSRYGDESLVIDLGQLKKDYQITKITLDAMSQRQLSILSLMENYLKIMKLNTQKAIS